MQKQNFLNLLTAEIQMRRLALFKIAVLTLAFFLCCALETPAQAKRPHKKRSQKVVEKNIPPKKAEKFVVAKSVLINPSGAVTVVNQAETDFLSGEASVAVNPKQPTIIRLGLAQNAVSIVEFPASDGIYYIHEGNPKFASVFQSPTKETDRSITIYPGEGFVAARDDGKGANLSATITLQMRSGLVLILELVPVSQLSKNAHRCVVNYNRDEVVAARRAAGLAFNLGEDVKVSNQPNTRANSKLVGGAVNQSDETVAENADKNESPAFIQTSLEVSKGSISRKSDADKSKQKPKTALELSRFVNRRLAECLKNPAKNLGAWTQAKNGLTLAVSSVTEIDAEQRLIVVAVRNETIANLRLVPGTPELEVQTSDEQGNALSVERLERTYVETTSLEGSVLPGSIAYYALVYRAPVMGASQRLKVLVSHREAADSPTVVALPNAAARKE
jgi:hypothetical protein